MVRVFTFIFILLIAALPAQNPLSDMEKFKQVKPREIGPAGMSGRVTAIDVQNSEPDVIYVGAASGGVWRSTNGGIDWQPLFDEQPTQNIGALALDQSNPDVIWVGTGEGNPRNSQNSGNGVYKSLDGGKNWKHVGLKNTHTIHRLIIDPRNSDVVYAASLGSAWGENEERGVFKTSDGGKTWKKVLYVDAETGCADLVMDPVNPNKLIAAMWEYRRWPWFFKSGGPGSGLYVSFDGGETWEKRTEDDGLPKGDLGRMGLAIAPSEPQVVYALIEAKKNGLYRSEDGGFKWKLVADKNIGNRPFYYADIFVDPVNENRLYNLHSIVTVSNDGGKTFENLVPWSKDIHPDHHAWWVHPQDPDYLIDGNDGGLAISRDRGKTWRFVENLPLAQFYHIEVDRDLPYNLYGGMQDNGSWAGPSWVWRRDGIRNSYWQEVSFGDGFDVVPDPQNNRYGYSMWQGGNLLRYDRETGDNVYIRPAHPEDVTLRFNWNAAIAVDPFEPNTVYYGSQFVHKSSDRGMSWTIISPDLTTNDPEKQKQLESGGLTYDVTEAENNTTIITIEPNPIEQGVIWVGTDDGYVQLTRDGGKSWSNLSDALPGAPKEAWIPHIHASQHNAGEAFVVLNNYRNNDWKPYLYHTNDFGKSWKRLVDEEDMPGYTLSVVQDSEVPGLIFLGTEYGLYISMDYGKSWQQWTQGYPAVSTMDLALQPDEHDLVIGTFGRAAYIFDDIRYLRHLATTPEALKTPLKMMPVNDAWLVSYQQPEGTRFKGQAEFSGPNQPFGAMLTFIANTDSSKEDGKTIGDSLIIEVFDKESKRVRMFRRKAEEGVNRTTWDLRQAGVRWPQTKKPEKSAQEPSGITVLPGTYKIRVTYGDYRDSAMVEVKFDPREDLSMQELQKREAIVNEFYARVEKATEIADKIRLAKENMARIDERLKSLPGEQADSLKKQSKALSDTLQALLEDVIDKEYKGINEDPEALRNVMSYVNAYATWAWDVPYQMARIYMQETDQKLERIRSTLNTILQSDWPAFREAVEESELSFFDEIGPVEKNNGGE